MKKPTVLPALFCLLLLAAAPAVGAPAPFPKVTRPDRGPSAAQLREKRRVLVAFVRPGMTKAQVSSLLGRSSLDFAFAKWGSGASYPELGITVTFTTEGVVREIQRHSEG